MIRRPADRKHDVQQSVDASYHRRAITSFSPRLMEVLLHIRDLNHHDMCTLEAFVSEIVKNGDRRRAVELKRYVGQRCDVVWPGQLEMKDALLTAVDPERVVATIERFPDVGPRDVPVHSLFMHHPSRLGNSEEQPLPLASEPTTRKDADKKAPSPEAAA